MSHSSLFLLAVIAMLLSSGCTTRAYRFIHDEKSYQIGVHSSAAVGSEMLSRERGVKVEYEVWQGIFNGGWIRTAPILQPRSVREEIHYGGRAGEVVHLAYREFRLVEQHPIPKMGEADEYKSPPGFFAAPSFYMNVQYDLSTGDEITFRNYRMKVHEATNQQVSFTVLGD